MKTASVTDLKNGLSSWLREVASGESILITDRRKAVAVLQPLEGGQVEERLARLIDQGMVAPPRRQLDPSELESLPLPKAPSLRNAILEEREDR